MIRDHFGCDILESTTRMLPQHLPQPWPRSSGHGSTISSVDDIAGARRLGEVTSYFLAGWLLDRVRRVGSRGFVVFLTTKTYTEDDGSNGMLRALGSRFPIASS